MAMNLFKRFKHSEPKQTKEMIEQNINPVKPNEPIKPIKTRKKQMDSHLYTKVIHYSPVGIMILISYTEDYFYSMIEFIGLLAGSAMSAVTMKSSFDQDSGKVDKYGEPIVLSHDRFYVLFSATEDDLYYLFHESTNLGNEIIEAIAQDIYDRCSPLSFNEACNDGILDINQFKNNNAIQEPSYDKYGKYTVTDSNLELTYMLGYEILLQLPECFTARDILDLIMIHVVDTETGDTDYDTTLYEVLHEYQIDEISDIDSYKPIIEALLNRSYNEADLDKLANPRYLYDDDPYEEDNGRMSDEELDEIFTTEYEKFSAVSSDDVQYEDIDEEIGDNEETENMRMEDILQDETSTVN